MKKIIWIIAILFLAVLCYWFFNSMNNPSQNNNGVIGQLKSLFPYGVSNNSTTGSISQTTSPNNANTNNSTGNTTAYDPLIQLSKRGIVGMTVVTPAPQDMSSTSSQSNIPYQSTVFSKTKLPVVRFVEHGTGYVYDVDSRAQNETKQTGTTVLRTYEASFGNYGNSIIFRYVKNDNSTIETYLGNIIPPTDSNSGQFASVKGTFLPENISDLAVAADGKSFDYILPTINGSAGVFERIDGSGNQQIFSSSLSEWLLDLKQGILTATTKAASGIPGYAYQVTNVGIFKKIIGGINGMTTNVSPDGNQLLYNTANGNQLTLFIRHSNGSSNKLAISTLPEKCVWSKKSVILYCAVPNTINSGTYPDEWYQGLQHFTDGIWKIDSNSGIAVEINNLSEDNIDAVTPILDPNENFLFFKNNNDGTPWSLDLRPAPGN